MTRLRWLLASRGVDRAFTGLLGGSIVLAWLATTATVELRSPADRAIVADALDNGILLGLVPPVAVLARTLQNRLAWLAETSARSARAERFSWLVVMVTAAGLVCAVIVVAAPDQLLTTLIVWDFFILLALAVLCAVVAGAALAWVAPGVAALVCSTPGIVPLQWNLLANGETQTVAGLAASGLMALACTVYVVLDDYGMARQARLTGRTPGVTDE